MNSKLKDKEHLIIKDEDILFFYNLTMKHRNKSVKGRKSIDSISKKFGIEIKKEKAGTCKNIEPEPNKITLYDDEKGLNQRLFLHLRNAFAHCYIEIAGDRCKLLDWSAYVEHKRCSFGKNRVTLLGDVNYEDFKMLMDEFFSPHSKINKQDENKNK